jgi:hypothetical protein
MSQFQRTPAAVVYAFKTSDVQAAVKCAYSNGVQVGGTGAAGRSSNTSSSSNSSSRAMVAVVQQQHKLA